LRNVLIVGEFAVALVLLIGAGLLMRSFMRIQQANYGFDPGRLLTFDVSLPKQKYASDQQIRAFYQQLMQKLATQPGVTSVGAATSLPLSGGWTQTYQIQGKQLQPEPHAFFAVTTPDFFQTMRIPHLRGRVFRESDADGAPLVAIIDSVTARAFFPNEDPVGKYIGFDRDPKTKQQRWREIVGVVGAVRHLSALKEDTKGQVYLPYQQSPTPYMSVAIRTQADPLLMANTARRVVADVDPQQPIYEVRTMDDLLGEFVAQPRFNMILFAIFAGLALVLASVGIYGVISYSVAQRTQEIGVRMALGATRHAVLRLILSQGMRLALIGVAIGVVGAVLATRVLATMLFGVSTLDPIVYGGIALLLAGVALLATYVPARRATKVDPMVALRYQ
jgi:putative ABC transport system permease protein